jgi:FkbM family methyltransferase
MGCGRVRPVSEGRIRSRAAGAWVLGVAAGVMALAAGVGALRQAPQPGGGAGLFLVVAAGAACTAGVGAVIAAKSGNATGWWLVAGGTALAAGSWAGQIATAGCAWVSAIPSSGPEPSPAALGASVVGPALWAACVITALTFFPFGTLGPIRERGMGGRRILAAPVLAWLGTAAIAMAALTSSREIGVLSVGVARFCGADPHASVPTLAPAGAILLAAGFLAALVFGWRRYRAVSGSDRGQLRPVVATASVTAVAVAAAFAVPQAQPFAGDQPVMVVAWCLGALAVPTAVVISVVRYRTFGIFRFVGFMADYRIWTVGLATTGLGVAAILAWVITVLAGLEDVPLAVAAVALLVGTGFAPLWWRAQARVNRRYGQHQEDPASVLEALAGRSRDPGADVTALRGPVFDLVSAFAPLVVVEGVSGMRFALPTADREVGRHTFVHGAYDLATMRCAMGVLAEIRGVAAEHVLAGGTVLDVGANIGTSIVPLLRLFGADAGVAVEPAPANVDLLRLNLALNELTDRVRVLPVGLSDRDGNLELEIAEGNWGDHRLRSPEAIRNGEEAERATISVEVRRLDALAQAGTIRPQSLSLAWLDVQGHEGQVLAGAGSLLSAGTPVVSEFWPSAMERSGGLRMFTDLVTAHFTQVVDLRKTQTDGRAVPIPAAGLAALTDRYADPDAFTDLLLLP